MRKYRVYRIRIGCFEIRIFRELKKFSSINIMVEIRSLLRGWKVIYGNIMERRIKGKNKEK